MTWQQKSDLIQKDPVTFARHFEHMAQLFIKDLLNSNLMPVGEIVDFYYRLYYYFFIFNYFFYYFAILFTVHTTYNRELTDPRRLHDGAVRLREMTSAHAYMGTRQSRAKVDDVGERDLPASRK